MLETTLNGLKCQMLLSNYNINKMSSLEYSGIFQIYLLVLVGICFLDSLLTYHFIVKISQVFLMQPSLILLEALLLSFVTQNV